MKSSVPSSAPCKWSNFAGEQEADEYRINGKRVTSLKKVRIGTKEYKVTTREISIPYNDMGHTYHGTSDHYFIEEVVFGIKMEFDLNTLIRRKAIFALVFTTE